VVVDDCFDDPKSGVVRVEVVDASDDGALTTAVHNGWTRECAVVRPHQSWWNVRVELVKGFLFFQHDKVRLAERIHASFKWLAQDSLRWGEALGDW
jgi:hypothetical protein